MKKPTEYETLLDAALDDDGALRQQSLSGLTAAVRTRRRRRAAARYTVASLLVAAACWLTWSNGRYSNRGVTASNPSAVPSSVVKVIPGTAIELISDEQLLDVFAGRAVALVGSADRQRLLLLDEGE